MKYLLILLFLTSSAYGQDLGVGIAPTSIPVWGKVESVHMIEASYSHFGLHYFWMPEVTTTPRTPPLSSVVTQTTRQNTALSYRYPVFDFFRVGLISFLDNFPEAEGSRINLWMDAGVDIWRFRVSYNHISNVFMGRSNLGYDSISVSYRIKTVH